MDDPIKSIKPQVDEIMGSINDILFERNEELAPSTTINLHGVSVLVQKTVSPNEGVWITVDADKENTEATRIALAVKRYLTTWLNSLPAVV